MMRHKMRVVAILTFSLINGETAPSTPTNGGKCQQLPPTIIVDKIAEGYVRTAPEKTTPARSTPGTNLSRWNEQTWWTWRSVARTVASFN